MGKAFLRKEIFIFFAIVAVFLLVLFGVAPFAKREIQTVNQIAQSGTGNLKIATLSVGNVTFPVEIADTLESRTHGLSDRQSLPQNQGLFFIFDAPATAGIWMKDMHFPLDIIWMDATGMISTIKENISPATYPEVFLPASPAQYVLEVNAGFVARNHLYAGEIVKIAPTTK